MARRKIAAEGCAPAEWGRVCATIDGFRLTYGRWPDRILVEPGHLAGLVSRHLHPAGYALVSSVVALIPDLRGMPTAEDRTGAQYLYSRDFGPEGELDAPALAWFGRAVLRRPWG
jgi:hypothetical protein